MIIINDTIEKNNEMNFAKFKKTIEKIAAVKIKKIKN